MYTDGTYLEKNPTWHIEDSEWKAEQISKIISRNNLQLKTVCEVGCGAGEILNQLYNELPDVVEFLGYDISQQAIEMCKSREKERLKYYNIDFIETKEFYDLILAIDLIEHIEDCFSFMRELQKRATYKIYNIPLELWINCLVPGKLLSSRRNVGHLHYFNKELAFELLLETGHEIIDFELTPLYQLPHGHSMVYRMLKYARMFTYKISKDLSDRTLGGCSLIVLTK
jgi:Methyltransferase domain